MGVVRPCSGDKTDIVVQPDGVGELEQFLFDRLFSEGLAASHPSWSTARWAKISPRVLRRNTKGPGWGAPCSAFHRSSRPANIQEHSFRLTCLAVLIP